MAKQKRRRKSKTNWIALGGTAVGYGVVASVLLPELMEPGSTRDVLAAGAGIGGGLALRRKRRDIGNGLILGGALTGAFNWAKQRGLVPGMAPGLPAPSTPPAIPPRVGASGSGGNAAVNRAQRQLSSLGVYSGRIDGVAGPATRTAIQQFQTREGLPPTGQLDAATTARLNAAVPNPGGPALGSGGGGGGGGGSLPSNPTCESLRQFVYNHKVSTGMSSATASWYAGQLVTFCNARGGPQQYLQAVAPNDLADAVGRDVAAQMLRMVGRSL